eukprot:gene5920-8165_t
MEFLISLFNYSTSIFEHGLESLNITPSSYEWLFPLRFSPEELQSFADNKVFLPISGLAPAFTYALILSFVRFFLHHFGLKPLALWAMKIQEVPFVSNGSIDKALPITVKNLDANKIKKYCADTGRKELDVNSYLLQRKKHSIINRKIVKFVEACWRFIFYFSFCIFGYFALFVPEMAKWIGNPHMYYENWPYHTVSRTILLYYEIELGAYIHQLMWTEVTRSDSIEMIIHHFVTISLILISYLTNHFRAGSILLILHDSADVFLESAKVFNYASKAKGNEFCKYVCDALFVIFAIVFLVTRLIFYPKYVVLSVLTEGIETYGCGFTGCYVFIGLLVSLQALHIFWFYLILKMAIKLIFTSGITKDERSDDEEEMEAEPSADARKKSD